MGKNLVLIADGQELSVGQPCISGNMDGQIERAYVPLWAATDPAGFRRIRLFRVGIGRTIAGR
jgi:hypothetical protein